MKLLHALWQDEAGFVITSELLIIVTIAVIGMIVGYVAIRDALVQELGDVAAAIGAIDQTYSYNGVSNTCSGAKTNGSAFTDGRDLCDLPVTPLTGAGVGAIVINTTGGGG
ncbi:MAG: hypothetical protein NTY19_29625 [Planctomycetota bacterium]|nr:hypothetical protein [Planctomycetota bacterium]